MFGNDRNSLRQMFFSVWHKHQQQLPLEPMEAMIADIITLHPEYHAMLGDEVRFLDRDYSPEQGESNPFLHMAMHISIREQLQTDRPAGIRTRYQQLLLNLADPHEVEHQFMECLGQMLWEAQRQNRMPDEQAYLECLQRLGR